MTCRHSLFAQKGALYTGLCPLCLQHMLRRLIKLIESPEWQRTELAAHLQGYSCPIEKALDNAITIAQAKELAK